MRVISSFVSSFVAFVLGSALAAIACNGAPREGRAPTEVTSGVARTGGSVVVQENGIASDSVVVRWNEIAVTALGAIAPFPGTRAMAAVQVAVFEAVDAITGGFEPYFGTIGARPGADPEAAAIVAAHDVLVWLLQLVPAQVTSLDAQRDAALVAIPDGEAKADGIAVGQDAALAVIAARTGDGATAVQFYVPASSDPYQWQKTPTCPATGGLFYHWRNVKPYGIQSSSQFRSPPPPALDGDAYAASFDEVQAVGYVGSPLRSQHQSDVARIYAAQPPHKGWNSIARQILARRQDSITETARTLAIMNMSLSDAHVSVFDTKYFYTTWRPETAIPRAAEDGNAATVAGPFTPFIATPCFPGYPSAHGAGAGAASRVLEAAYGRFYSPPLVNSDPAVEGVLLQYTDLKDIVGDVSDARVYGGIHFRFDQDEGEAMGRAVANYNSARHLKPRH